MLLGVISMFCFEILSDFGENCKKGKLEKSGLFGFLRHVIGNPCRGVTLLRSVGVPSTQGDRGAKMEPPRVHYGIALLRRGVDNLHS